MRELVKAYTVFPVQRLFILGNRSSIPRISIGLSSIDLAVDHIEHLLAILAATYHDFLKVRENAENIVRLL
jgi:hypothetical protein